ncbi:hypothetical protein D3C73_1009960 [compost metagenome]
MQQRLWTGTAGHNLLRQLLHLRRCPAVKRKLTELSRGFVEQKTGIFRTRHLNGKPEIPELHIVVQNIAVARHIMRPAAGMTASPRSAQVERRTLAPQVIEHFA